MSQKAKTRDGARTNELQKRQNFARQLKQLKSRVKSETHKSMEIVGPSGLVEKEAVIVAACDCTKFNIINILEGEVSFNRCEAHIKL